MARNGTNYNSAGYTNELTKQEIEVLELISQGFNNKRIAKELYLSESTIKTHKAKLYQKLHANDVLTLVLKAQRLGLVKSPSDDSARYQKFIQEIHTAIKEISKKYE